MESRECWLVFAVVDHAVELYSRTGLSDPSYTVLSVCSLAPYVVPASLRMIASFLRAFPSVRRVCVFHVSLESYIKVSGLVFFFQSLCTNLDRFSLLIW